MPPGPLPSCRHPVACSEQDAGGWNETTNWQLIQIVQDSSAATAANRLQLESRSLSSSITMLGRFSIIPVPGAPARHACS